MRFATKAIHVGQDPDPATGSTIPAIHISTTYTQESPGKHKGFEYSRSQNPTRQNLEKCMAALEGGEDAAMFASGLAATQCVLQALLRPGDKVVAFSDLYGGTYRIFEKVFRPWGLNIEYVDDNKAESFAAKIDDRTKMVWIETPTNPLLRLIDIAALSKVTKSKNVPLVVDNTFASPVLQTPIAMGADVVVHSTTKYIGGHSDVVGGAVVVRDRKHIESIRFHQNASGGVPSPFDCYMTHRGIKTLALRMKQHVENAKRVAAWAVEQKVFEKVSYPGLPTHPDHALASKQMCGPGGIVTCVLKGGLDAAKRFMESTRLFSCAESLGGVESLVNHPAIMTHASMPREVRERIGVVDGLIRLSVGIEDADDLIEDLSQAAAEAAK